MASKSNLDRKHFDETLKQRFFFAPSFEIYGGIAGLFDYGPIGCSIKANVLAEWRRFFILAENMLEIDSPAVTPLTVLETSGHVEKFSDVMVKDTKTGECLRADHFLEDRLEKMVADPKTPADVKATCERHLRLCEGYTKEQLGEVIREFDFKSPNNNPLSDPVDFNMMFSANIGPTGEQPGFLRPETAQGIFVCFKRLYDFNNQKLPFAAAQIGTAFRNEIAPRNGLLRAREFQMAEIEHFVDPQNKDHPKFSRVANLEVPLFSRVVQEEGGDPTKMTLGEAVEKGIIANQTLAYFMARIYLFMERIGIDTARLRFRQHLANEMAHYACDCWDCELHTSHGWVECVGCADRSCYDLERHSKVSKTSLTAAEPLPEPVSRDVVAAVPNKKEMGKAFKKANKDICDHLAALSNEEAEAIEAKLNGSGEAVINVGGTDYTLTASMLTFERKTVTDHERKFTPSVIEPSFGIGRIVYALLEHNFKQREEDKKRGWFSLPPNIAPVKCAILSISKSAEFDALMQDFSHELMDRGVTCRVDDSGAAIGKKYARLDEIAIPFAITLDFESLSARTVTVRERNTMSQIRVPMDDIAGLLTNLAEGFTSWDDAAAKYPRVGDSAEADPPAEGKKDAKTTEL